MPEALMATTVFLCLVSASLIAMVISPRLAARHRDEETNTVVRLVANIFVVMTSLVFGLLINSSKGTFETVNASAHSYATNLILLDHSLRQYGEEASDARHSLLTYIEAAIATPARADDALTGEADPAGKAMDVLAEKLNELNSYADQRGGLLQDIRGQFQQIVAQRWAIIEQSEGVIPMPLMVVLVTWLVLIFASFGYRDPTNVVTATSFVIGASLLALTFYLVLDMDSPFRGLIQVSDAPLRRALAEVNS